MQVKIITVDDNLAELVRDINESSWDDANEMAVYTEDALRAYLQRPDTVFIACYKDANSGPVLMGIASSRIEMKPYDHELWLYVDEVDVCADQRQQGAGKLIMRKLLEIAEQQGCEELWLGTEADNHPAKALYNSLDPDEVADVVGFTFETDE